jgi:ubiquinone/menaquinone biosynthesis C-methylase UbiE
MNVAPQPKDVTVVGQASRLPSGRLALEPTIGGGTPAPAGGPLAPAPTDTTQDYYEKYWTTGRDQFSGDKQGYAGNLRRWMQAQLRNTPADAAILEVGCGDGSFTRSLAEHSSRVTAVDISASQIERNARAHPEITFVQHDLAQPLPFPKDAFDVIWCSEVLEHLFDPGFALHEMHRVLSPGGRLLVTVPYHGVFKDVLIALFKWDEHFTPTNPHIRFFTRNTLARLAASAGFADIKTTTCGMNRPLRDLLIATNILLSARKR